MTIKKFVKTGAVLTVALLASNNAAFAASCEPGAVEGTFLDGYCLTDGNANFSIVHDAGTDQYGMDMSIDGLTQVWVLDFLIDHQGAGGKDNPHVGTDAYLGAIDGTYTGTNQVSINNKDIGGYGTVDLGFELNYDGTDAATLTQTFTFTNTSGGTLTDLSFLALTDVTLGTFGQGFFDQGELTTGTTTNPTGYRQWSDNDPGYQNFELLASVNIAVDEYEVSVAGTTPGAGIDPCTNGDLCDRAYTAKDLTLTNGVESPAGGDDLMMAARWLRNIADGGTFTYAQTFEIFDPTNLPTAAPVPAAVWLFASGLLGLVGVARRKQSLKA